MIIQVQQGSYADDGFTRIMMKAINGDPLDEWEKQVLQFRQNPWFSYWENGFFQYKIGLLPEEAWQSSRETMKRRLGNPIYQEWWEAERETWSADFAHEVDEVLREVRSNQ